MVDLNGHEKFDGFPVDSYGGRFSGSFDIDEEDGRKLRFGDEVVLVVFAKVKDPTHKEDKLGDIRRINVLKPDEVWVCTDPAKRTAVLNALTVESSARLFEEEKPSSFPVKAEVQEQQQRVAERIPVRDDLDDDPDAIGVSPDLAVDLDEGITSSHVPGQQQRVNPPTNEPKKRDPYLTAFLQEA